jgi:putative aldouronate transport system permease protein
VGTRFRADAGHGRELARSLRQVRKAMPLYALMVLGMAIILVYRYLPMAGLVIAFKDYRITRGILSSPWSGLVNFQKFLFSPFFGLVLGNTIVISVMRLAISFPAPIALALMLNEVSVAPIKRVLQTIYYLPHFISWVVVGNLLYIFFAPSSGLLNDFMTNVLGLTSNILINPGLFRLVLVTSDTWKEIGWTSIIYLAAVTTIDPALYEAAYVDGARKGRQLWSITLPCLMPTIMTMLLIRVGYILNAGFDQIFILQNSMVYDVSEILDTYIYKVAFLQGQYAIGAVAGLFKSVIGLIMVLVVNRIADRFGQRVL